MLLSYDLMADNSSSFLFKTCRSNGQRKSVWFQRVDNVYTAFYIKLAIVNAKWYVYIVEILNAVQGFKEVELPLGWNSKEKCGKICRQEVENGEGPRWGCIMNIKIFHAVNEQHFNDGILHHYS